VQSVVINRGKSFFQDPTPASQCSIELIPTSTFPALTLGQFIDIRDSNSGASAAYFAGKIIDIQRSYAIPYNSTSGAAPADRVVITVVGGTGVLASGYGRNGSPGNTYDAGFTIIVGSINVARVWCTTPQNLPYTGTVKDMGQNVIMNTEGPWFDYLNLVMNTIQYSVNDADLQRTGVGAEPLVYGADFYPTGQTGKSISFVDDGSTGATVYKYAGIEYASSVQSAFTQISVTSSLATQVSYVGNPPYVGFTYPTAAATTSQASNLGTYILAVNNSTTPTPSSISTSTAQQASAAALGKLSECPIGTAVTVKFRGTTVVATVCGISVSYYPDMASIRLSLTPSLGTPFTLDSSAFGVLDTNRLGYP
jgi:hypothetical protein